MSLVSFPITGVTMRVKELESSHSPFRDKPVSVVCLDTPISHKGITIFLLVTEGMRIVYFKLHNNFPELMSAKEVVF